MIAGWSTSKQTFALLELLFETIEAGCCADSRRI
jgi:hypothetical protein